MVALPWLAPELQHLESDPEGLIALSDSVQQYLAIRPESSSQDALNPFTRATTAEDTLHLGGSGSTSFLPEVGVAKACCSALWLAQQWAHSYCMLKTPHKKFGSYRICALLESLFLLCNAGNASAVMDVYQGVEGQPVEAHHCSVL